VCYLLADAALHLRSPQGALHAVQDLGAAACQKMFYTHFIILVLVMLFRIFIHLQELSTSVYQDSYSTHQVRLSALRAGKGLLTHQVRLSALRAGKGLLTHQVRLSALRAGKGLLTHQVRLSALRAGKGLLTHQVRLSALRAGKGLCTPAAAQVLKHTSSDAVVFMLVRSFAYLRARRIACRSCSQGMSLYHTNQDLVALHAMKDTKEHANMQATLGACIAHEQPSNSFSMCAL